MKHHLTATLLLAILLMMAALPALASSQGASPADIALWQSQAPAPQGEFQKIITVLTPDAATDTIHRRLTSSQRGAIIDNSPRFLPIRITAAEFWATLNRSKYTFMIDLQANPDGMSAHLFTPDSLSAIWAGNRIFEMLNHDTKMYGMKSYDPTDDTVDFSGGNSPPILFDDAIAVMESFGWATWTRLY